MLDLRHYGLGWSIDNKSDSVIVPPDYLTSISNVTFDAMKNSFNVKRYDGSNVEYLKGARLGAGSYGEVFACTIAGDPKEYIVKLIADGAMRDVVKEAILQIIIIEETKNTIKTGGLNGPFAPILYDVGYNARYKSCYLFSERLPMTLQNFWQHGLTGKSADVASQIIAEMVSKIGSILNQLYNSLEFNHRDLKSDNIMVRKVGGLYQPCLIDFGFSCIKYGERRIDCNMSRFQYCALRRRDLTQLLYEMYRYYTLTPEIKEMLKSFLTFPRGGRICRMWNKECGISSWGNTYEFLNNIDQNPNGAPAVVHNAFMAYRLGQPWTTKLAWVPPADSLLGPKPKAKAVRKTSKRAKPAAVKTCPAGKELNPKTKRCVNLCPPGKKRNAAFKCVADKAAAAAAPAGVVKTCPAGKELNPKTKRCVNLCPPGKKRNAAFKCVADKAAAAAPVGLAKTCPAGKELNPKTKRCVKVCPPGKRRNNTTFKCVK
jgi:hypothetical protein